MHCVGWYTPLSKKAVEHVERRMVTKASFWNCRNLPQCINAVFPCAGEKCVDFYRRLFVLRRINEDGRLARNWRQVLSCSKLSCLIHEGAWHKVEGHFQNRTRKIRCLDVMCTVQCVYEKVHSFEAASLAKSVEGWQPDIACNGATFVCLFFSFVAKR